MNPCGPTADVTGIKHISAQHGQFKIASKPPLRYEGTPQTPSLYAPDRHSTAVNLQEVVKHSRTLCQTGGNWLETMPPIALSSRE